MADTIDGTCDVKCGNNGKVVMFGGLAVLDKDTHTLSFKDDTVTVQFDKKVDYEKFDAITGIVNYKGIRYFF
jgi:hypothetical protein